MLDFLSHKLYSNILFSFSFYMESVSDLGTATVSLSTLCFLPILHSSCIFPTISHPYVPSLTIYTTLSFQAMETAYYHQKLEVTFV